MLFYDLSAGQPVDSKAKANMHSRSPPPPRPRTDPASAGQAHRGWACSLGACCCPTIRHMDENQYLSLPPCSGVPEAQIPMSRTVGRVPNKGRVTLTELDQGQSTSPGLLLQTTRPQPKWQARPRGPESWAPAAWSLQEHVGAPTQGRSSRRKVIPSIC